MNAKHIIAFFLICSTMQENSARIRPIGSRMWDFVRENIEQQADFIIQQTEVPFTITIPGFYRLAESLTLNGSTIITVSSNDVVLDLNGKTLSGNTTAMAVSSGFNNVVIRNGFITGAFSTGITASAGAANIVLYDLTIQDVGTGINVTGITSIAMRNCFVTNCSGTGMIATLCNGILIEECNFYANGLYGIDFEQSFNGKVSSCEMGLNNAVGLRINQSHTIVVEDCVAYDNDTVGFELLQSSTNSIRRCQALGNGGITGINGIIESGFYSSGGVGNIFESCIANGTTTTATNAASQVAGFALFGTEQCSKIINCESGNTNSPSGGSAIPYGILLQSTLDTLGTVTQTNTVPVDSAPQSIAWHPNSQLFAVGCSGGDLAIYLYNRVLKQVSIASVNTSFNGVFSSLAWSPDGSYLAVGGQASGNNNIQVYSLDRTDRTLTLLPGCTQIRTVVDSVAWSPNGMYLAAAGTSPDYLSIYFFNRSLQTLTLVQNINVSSGLSVAWSPDGSYVAIGDFANISIYAFDKSVTINTLTLVAQQSHGSLVLGLAWSNDGDFIALGGDPGTGGATVRIYQFNKTSQTLTLLNSQSTGGLVNNISLSPNSLYLAVVGSAGLQMFLFNRNNNQLQLINSLTGNLLGLSWSLDGRYILFGINSFTTNNLVIISALLFPNNNIISNNRVYCNVGNQYPGGVGISGSSIQNFIAANTSYQNIFNYEFVTNTYSNGLDGTPTLLQNISIPPFNEP